MPSDRASQTIRRRRLAAELRRLRERADLTGDQAAELLGWSGSKISRIETHRIGVRPADLDKLLDLYQVAPAHREQIKGLLSESAASGWLESVTAGFPADYATYLYAEAEADAVWIWDPQIVPGLVQTDTYARHVLAGYQEMFKLPPGDAERRIQIRRRRQAQFLDRQPPLRLSVVIDESTLYRRFGDETVMRDQLLRLEELTALPNVTLRVLPLAGRHPIGTGAFSYLHFDPVHDVPLSDMVEVEHLTGSYYLEDDERVFRYRVTFESLTAMAAGKDESRAMVSAAARSHWDSTGPASTRPADERA
jgi:transcriptional regulator with XRE-family HTH domain